MYSPKETKLCLDVMLGGLRAPLRMIGYDTVYPLDRDLEADKAVIELCERENRLLLTRDRELVERVERSILLAELEPIDQLGELAAKGFSLSLAGRSRCSRCNGPLDRVESGPGPAEGPDPSEEPVWQCRDCGQYYWHGSHWENLADRLENL